MPDLNTLPPSPNPTSLPPSRTASDNSEALPHRTRPSGGNSPSSSPSRSASISLQAAAAMNAGLRRESTSSPSSGSILQLRQVPSAERERRRSQVLHNLQANDPSSPAPGEMAVEGHTSTSGSTFTSAHPQPMAESPLLAPRVERRRTPSLGELHQELEAEQEAQVNRLLQQIRQQQIQLQALQPTSSVAAEDSSGTSTPAVQALPQGIPHGSSPMIAHAGRGSSPSLPRSPVFPRNSFDHSRSEVHRRSVTPSRGLGASPRMRATSISQESADSFALSGRDETSFYQAETQSLTRENQMLRHRIRELERQLADAGTSTSAATTSQPAHHSNLSRETSVAESSRPTTGDNKED